MVRSIGRDWPASGTAPDGSTFATIKARMIDAMACPPRTGLGSESCPSGQPYFAASVGACETEQRSSVRHYCTPRVPGTTDGRTTSSIHPPAASVSARRAFAPVRRTPAVWLAGSRPGRETEFWGGHSQTGVWERVKPYESALTRLEERSSVFQSRGGPVDRSAAPADGAEIP